MSVQNGLRSSFVLAALRARAFFQCLLTSHLECHLPTGMVTIPDSFNGETRTVLYVSCDPVDSFRRHPLVTAAAFGMQR